MSMRTWFAGGILVTASAIAVAILPHLDGPPLWAFIVYMVLPALAAAVLAPRTSRFAFLAAAIYAALAGLRRFLQPEGNDTASEQLSTAAIFAMLVPILSQLAVWLVRAATQRPARQKQ